MLPLPQATQGQITADRLPTREQIVRLQSEMLPHQCTQPEPEHIFHDGWYERRLLVPAGMLMVGKTHKHAHPVGVISGRALLISEFGRDEVRAGFFSVSPPGVKRVVLAIEDTLFVTLHRNEGNGRDLEAIERFHIEPEALIPAAQPSQVLQ
jgi:quercetin dioxygenase-like cupin family protein